MNRREWLSLGGLAATYAALRGNGRAADSRAKRPTKTGFVPPDEAARRKALGSLENLTLQDRRLYDPADHFEPMPEPSPGEWLTEHDELGQTFEQFLRSRPPRPEKGRSTIYLLPFGDFDGEWSPRPSHLEAVASAFFQLPVQTLRAKPLEGLPVTVREREKGHKQYLSTDFLRMLRNELPDDGFCIVGITMQDLYPDPRWNYVFGQASLKDRVGIYSFARYDPQFWNEPRTDAAKTLLLVRSLAVLLHETSHIFGMKHCIYYHCLVNGSNSLTESDRQPMHLCPVCLRKLQSATGCDLFQRDQALQKEYARLGIKAEADWIARRLKYVTGG